MAGSGLLALLDDITMLLDDVAVLSKAAATKTIGITGDDLAVNSTIIVGVDPKRELPIVWSVAKGSFKNKLYLIPGALALNFVAPFLITPILMLGGAYLCYEGMEKILHKDSKKHHKDLTAAAIQSEAALIKFEQDKIKGAINTDLILSGEIIVVTLGTVATEPFLMQLSVLCAIGIAITVGIYGLVAAIVKLDDLGLHFSRARGNSAMKRALRFCGHGLIQAAPVIMKVLGVVGTAAMLLVGGELIVHGIPPVHHFVQALNIPFAGIISALITGVITGIACIGAVKIFNRMRKRKKITLLF